MSEPRGSPSLATRRDARAVGASFFFTKKKGIGYESVGDRPEFLDCAHCYCGRDLNIEVPEKMLPAGLL
jgi:hypothetical protein